MTTDTLVLLAALALVFIALALLALRRPRVDLPPEWLARLQALERTTQATAQIASMIGAVQRDTRDVVGSMSAAAPQVESSVDKAQSAARALGEIRAGAALALDNIRDVASATLEQSVANQSVAEHIERIASMVAQSARTAEQARHSAQQLEVLADQLNAAVAKFQV